MTTLDGAGRQSVQPAGGHAELNGERPAASLRSDIQKRNARHDRFSQAFANIVAVLMRDPVYRSMRLADLEAHVLPPVMAGQWRLGQSRPPAGLALETAASGTMLVPVAVALWARVSGTVAERLSSSQRQPMLLPRDWVSGSEIWLTTIAGDPRAVPSFLAKLRDTEFKATKVKLRARADDGSASVQTLDEFLSKTGH